MKKLILGALAVTMVAGPIATAPAAAAQERGYDRRDDRDQGRGDERGYDRRDDRGSDRRDDRGYNRRDGRQQQYRNWRRGERFDSRYARNYGEIDYRRYRGLRQPPRGYHWVRSGNDALLVGIASGVIASVIAGSIR